MECSGWSYHDLFRLCKVVLRVPVQLHSAQLRDRHEFLGYDLGGIEQVESEPLLILFVHDLNAELMISVIGQVKRRARLTSHSGNRPASIAS